MDRCNAAAASPLVSQPDRRKKLNTHDEVGRRSPRLALLSNDAESGWHRRCNTCQGSVTTIKKEEVTDMPTKSSFGESFGDKSAGMADELSNRASEAKSKVSDLARSTADAIDDGRSRAADSLDSAAETLKDKARNLPGGEKVSEFAHATADRIGKAADYVRNKDVRHMMSDVETIVANNPGPSLLIAAAFGFLIGRAITRD